MFLKMCEKSNARGQVYEESRCLGQEYLGPSALSNSSPQNSHPMGDSKGKLHEDTPTPPNQVWIVWTAGWVEPCYKWMMVTILG